MHILCIPAMIILVLLPGELHATVLSAVLYPSAAQVEEQLSVDLHSMPGNDAVGTFRIPQAADPQSLTLTAVDGQVQVRDVSWQQVRRADSPEMAALRAEIDAKTATQEELQGKMQGLEGQIAFWRELRPRETQTPAQAAALAESVGQNIPALASRLAHAQRQAAEATKALEVLKHRLDELAGATEQEWEVRVVLTRPTAQRVELRCGYMLHDAGWSPSYNLNALPRQGMVELGFEAEVWQRSGYDWNGVHLQLATAGASQVLTPPTLPEWSIRPRQRPVAMPRTMAKEETASFEFKPMAAPAPQQAELGTMRIWDLGKRDLTAGPGQRVTIRSQSLKAEFSFLVRPALSDRAFLRAKMTSQEVQDLPSGPALFLVDGALVAKQAFSMADKESVVFFGQDRLVGIKTELLEKKTGQRGLLASRQTCTWKWRVTITNGRSTPIAVRMEEPRPQPRDQRIELAVHGDPQPQTPADDPHLLVWDLNLQPAAKQSITWGLDLSAPEDLDLDLGWR